MFKIQKMILISSIASLSSFYSSAGSLSGEYDKVQNERISKIDETRKFLSESIGVRCDMDLVYWINNSILYSDKLDKNGDFIQLAKLKGGLYSWRENYGGIFNKGPIVLIREFEKTSNISYDLYEKQDGSKNVTKKRCVVRLFIWDKNNPKNNHIIDVNDEAQLNTPRAN
jgi:hypothetical protein